MHDFVHCCVYMLFCWSLPVVFSIHEPWHAWYYTGVVGTEDVKAGGAKQTTCHTWNFQRLLCRNKQGTEKNSYIKNRRALCLSTRFHSKRSVYWFTMVTMDLPFFKPTIGIWQISWYIVRYCQTAVFFNSFYPSSVRQWNSLPENIKEAGKQKIGSLTVFFSHCVH